MTDSSPGGQHGRAAGRRAGSHPAVLHAERQALGLAALRRLWRSGPVRGPRAPARARHRHWSKATPPAAPWRCLPPLCPSRRSAGQSPTIRVNLMPRDGQSRHRRHRGRRCAPFRPAGAAPSSPRRSHKAVLYAAGFTHPGPYRVPRRARQRRDGVVPRPVMMLAHERFRTVPVTIHVPLRTVPDSRSPGH